MLLVTANEDPIGEKQVFLWSESQIGMIYEIIFTYMETLVRDHERGFIIDHMLMTFLDRLFVIDIIMTWDDEKEVYVVVRELIYMFCIKIDTFYPFCLLLLLKVSIITKNCFFCSFFSGKYLLFRNDFDESISSFSSRNFKIIQNRIEGNQY